MLKIISLGILLGSWSAVAVAVAQAPRLALSESSWDFGTRDQGQKDEKVIVLTNAGKRPLVIKKVTTTCGCVSAKFRPRTLVAGETADLTLELDTNRGEGEIKKFVIIESNDRVQPRMMLPMTGHIKPFWWLTAKEVSFGEVRHGTHPSQKFRIACRAGFEMKLKKVLAHPKDLFTVTTEPFEDEDGTHGWEVGVSVTGRMENGGLEGIVWCETDDEAIPNRGLRVTGEIKSSIKVTPQHLPLGRLEAGKTKTARITFEKEIGSGLRVVEIYCPDPQVKSELIEKEAGRAYEVEVSITPDGKKRDLRGTISIIVDEPGEVVFKVNYYGRVVQG